MAVFIRAKRVSDPFDERVKARLLSNDRHHHPTMSGYASSSGSEHEADDSILSGLVHAFFDLDEPTHNDTNNALDNTTEDDSDGSCIAHAVETVRDLMSRKSDPFSIRLHSDVINLAEALSGLKSSGSGYRRAVMARLRELGHNAGICKAKWESSGGLTAGNYEYIDTVFSEKDDERYIIDLDFAEQFEVARATAEYEKLVAILPTVMVAKAEEVKQVVRVMADAAKRCLKSKDLSVPPWRKMRYMIAKWFGAYRRTVNPLPSSGGATVAGRGEIHRRAVGFEAATLRT